MRAHEFLFERRLGQSSPTSIKGYIENILTMLKHAEENPDTELLMAILVKQKPAEYAQFHPKPGEAQNLQDAWDMVYNEWQNLPPATNTTEQTANNAVLKKIWKHHVKGTVDGEDVSWKGETGYPLEIFDKTKEIKGSSRKSYNTGNMTEGIFACAIYLRSVSYTHLRAHET